MNTCFFRVLLLCLGLAAALPAMAGIDCQAPGNWAQRTVCQSAALRQSQARLQELAADARLRSQDQDAFDAQQREWAAERREPSSDRRLGTEEYMDFPFTWRAANNAAVDLPPASGTRLQSRRRSD